MKKILIISLAITVLVLMIPSVYAQTEITRPPNQTITVIESSVSGFGGSDFSFTAGGGTIPETNKNSVHQWRDVTGSAAEWVTPRVLDFGDTPPGGVMKKILWRIDVPNAASPGTYTVHWISHCESVPSGKPCNTVTDYKYTVEVKEDIVTESGCLIATATYGSELSLPVQQLREIRDNSLLQTNSGSAFMSGFNSIYYSFAPTVSDWERQNPVFKEAVKLTITPLISSLSLLNYVEMDTEASVLGYGISIIILNIGMYFVAPAVLIYSIKQRFN